MSPLDYILAVSVVIVAIGLVMTLVNLRVYRAPASTAPTPPGGPLITVAIPARNEEANLPGIVASLQAQTHATLEILVYDDHSTDRTGEILRDLIAADARVRAAQVEPLPPGWNGKQFACDQLGRQARGPWVLFTDADVRFQPACLSATLAEAQRLNVPLLSTFPRQEMGTLAERAIVPMIFFILFSYLPMPRMRGTKDPAASAGCGQFLFVDREAYLRAGGHAAFRDSMHDGIKMPRAFRAAGMPTDLFDAVGLCSVRMYRGLGQTWRGFAKNAYEGLGSVALLVFLTLMHAVGHVLPWVALALAAAGVIDPSPAVPLAAAAVAIALLQRALLAHRFRHPLASVLLHPLGVLAMTAIQWHSLYLHLTGQRAWRGRVLSAA